MTVVADKPQPASTDTARGFDAFTFLARFAPLIFLLVLMAVFAVLEPRFVSSVNLFNVMRQVSITGLLAIGMTFVILTAGIDLSIGSLLAFAGLAAAAVAKGGLQDRFTVGDLHHAPQMKDHHAVRYLTHNGEVVADENEGHARKRLEPHNKIHNLALDRNVECADCFVANDQLGSDDHCPRDADALILTA